MGRTLSGRGFPLLMLLAGAALLWLEYRRAGPVEWFWIVVGVLAVVFAVAGLVWQTPPRIDGGRDRSL